MTLSETPPEGLLDWIKAQKLDWRDYFIYRAGWQTEPLTGLRHKCVDAVCSACGETVKLSYVPGGGCGRAGYSTPFGFLHPVSGDALASGDKLACPMCGEEVEAKHVSSAQQLARYVWPMTAEAQGGKLLLYLWRVCRDVEKSGRVTWRVDPWEVYAFGGTSAAPVCLPETIITFFTPQLRSSSGILAVLPAPLTISGLCQGKTREPRSNTVW